jgi:hypothetical protein
MVRIKGVQSVNKDNDLTRRMQLVIVTSVVLAATAMSVKQLVANGYIAYDVVTRFAPILVLFGAVVVASYGLCWSLIKIFGARALPFSEDQASIGSNTNFDRRSMSSEIMQYVLDLIEFEVQRRPRAIEFEIAYQSRVAIDRIKFAIKHTEHFGPRTDEMREVGLQLLDALNRLESADRQFQRRFRSAPDPAAHETTNQAVNGTNRPSGQDFA